jgi:hypothetical protein
MKKVGAKIVEKYVSSLGMEKCDYIVIHECGIY